MKKSTILLMTLLLLAAVMLPMRAVAEGELSVRVYDALTMNYGVQNGSGQYEVISATLSDYTGVLVSTTNPPVSYDFQNGVYYTCTITVRDLVTGETATGQNFALYRDKECSSHDYMEPGDGLTGIYTTVAEYCNITATHHTERYFTEYRCVECNTFMFKEEGESVRPHSFNSTTGLCKCGLSENASTCTHANPEYRVVETECRNLFDDALSHWYVDICDVYCIDCSVFLYQQERWDESDAESHDFDLTGVCNKCGYINKCKHSNLNTVLLETEYVKVKDNEEEHIRRAWKEDVCTLCLQTVQTRYSVDTWQKHDYGEDGVCVCGYEQGCLHADTARRDGAVVYVMDSNDALQHMREQDYDIYCLDCGQVISSSTESVPDKHIFQADGYCICGFYKDPTLQPLTVALNAWSHNAVINTQIGATVHINGGSGDYSIYWSASSAQGKYVQGPRNALSWSITPMTPDTWRFCIAVHDNSTGENTTVYSGAVVVTDICQHSGKLLDNGLKYLQVEYRFDVDGDILRHQVIHYETAALICADCNAEILGDVAISLNRKEVHAFDPVTNVCVCGAARIENFDNRLRVRLREMVEENWDPYDKWTWTYENWDDLWHNTALYVNDRIFGLEYSQILADMAALIWTGSDLMAEGLQYLEHPVFIAGRILGLDITAPEYSSSVEILRARFASEYTYFSAGITTEQVGVVADIVGQGMLYAREQTINEYESISDDWLSVIETVNGSLKEKGIQDEEVPAFITTWLKERFPELEDALAVNNQIGEGVNDAVTTVQILVDIYNTTLQTRMINTYTEAYIDYMENALNSIDNNERTLRTTLQTLINETEDKIDNSGFVGSIYYSFPDWTGSAELYLDQYKNLACEEIVDQMLGQTPGSSYASLLFLYPSLMYGDKVDDLLAYKQAYEIAKGSRDSLLSAIDVLAEPLTQKKLDELLSKFAFYTGSCQTASDYYNKALQHDADKGLPVSPSSYNGELFLEEVAAYMNIFLRNGETR